MARSSTSFPKGTSGNPKGAPFKEDRISTLINKELDKIIEERKSRGEGETYEEYVIKMTKRQKIAQSIVDNAISNEDPELKYKYENMVVDRTEGKPQQSTDVTSKGESIQGLTVVVPALEEVIHSEEDTPSV